MPFSPPLPLLTSFSFHSDCRFLILIVGRDAPQGSAPCCSFGSPSRRQRFVFSLLFSFYYAIYNVYFLVDGLPASVKIPFHLNALVSDDFDAHDPVFKELTVFPSCCFAL